MTRHHSIPKALKPLWNIEIPVCEDCHKEINQNYQNKNNGHDDLKNEIRRLEFWADKLLRQRGELENKVIFLEYKVKEREKEIKKLKKNFPLTTLKGEISK